MLDRFFSSASDLAIGEREARLLLSALAGLGLVKADKDGYFSAAISNLSRSAFIFSQWTRLADVIQADQPPLAMDIPGCGSQVIIPIVIRHPGSGPLKLSGLRNVADYGMEFGEGEMVGAVGNGR